MRHNGLCWSGRAKAGSAGSAAGGSMTGSGTGSGTDSGAGSAANTVEAAGAVPLVTTVMAGGAGKEGGSAGAIRPSRGDSFARAP